MHEEGRLLGVGSNEKMILKPVMLSCMCRKLLFPTHVQEHCYSSMYMYIVVCVVYTKDTAYIPCEQHGVVDEYHSVHVSAADM